MRFITAYRSLKFALDQAFQLGNAKICYVDPQKRNEKAIALYKRLGFKEMPHPDEETSRNHLYFEINREEYLNRL